MSQHSKKNNETENSVQINATTSSHQARQSKIRQIEALYKSQIKQIYQEGKQKPENLVDSTSKNEGNAKQNNNIYNVSSSAVLDKKLEHSKSNQFLEISKIHAKIDNSKFLNGNSESNFDDSRVRASIFLKGESTRTMEILRKQNQTKQLKIRDLTNKCENLIEKLRSYVPSQKIQEELDSLRQFSDKKMQRLENLLKIKNEETFFKIKLQVIALLQEFQIPKEQITAINQINNQALLFSFMSKKIKLQLKDIRSREQESSFELQKDKIVNQKFEERVHYLMETNELLKLSESKLKHKIEDLKSQLNQFIQRIKSREKELQERENEIFRLKKINEEFSLQNQKFNQMIKNVSSQKSDELKIFEAKQKQMKILLSNYFLEKKKLEGELEEKESYIEQILIKEKFLEQENQRVNREYVRWKERYEWLEREKETKHKEQDDDKFQLVNQFEEYKLENNPALILSYKTDIDEALRKVEEYQFAYQNVLTELDNERRLLLHSEEENQRKIQELESQWLERVRSLQKIKQEEIFEINADNESRIVQLRQEYEKKQKLLSEEMQARLKALLAQKDKKTTQKLIELQSQNDELRREIERLEKVISVKEALINVINSKKMIYQ